MGVLEMGSIILFYVSSVYVSKSYTALQEMDKNKKQNSSWSAFNRASIFFSLGMKKLLS